MVREFLEHNNDAAVTAIGGFLRSTRRAASVQLGHSLRNFTSEERHSIVNKFTRTILGGRCLESVCRESDWSLIPLQAVFRHEY